LPPDLGLSASMKRVVFTDLDGTLLDAVTYSYRAALPGLECLRKRGIPLVFCSAKTRAEQQACREELGVADPFIVENGGAAFVPADYFPFPLGKHRNVQGFRVIELGRPYREVREILGRLREEGLRFRAFGDMTVAEVARETGLSEEAAELAKRREYDETVLLDDEPGGAAVALQRIESAGLDWTYGGRFHHVMLGNDKGKAVEILAAGYRRLWGSLETIGIGDSLNDLPMLSVVDVPLLVQKRDGSWEDIEIPRLRRIGEVGPRAWAAAMRGIFGG